MRNQTVRQYRLDRFGMGSIPDAGIRQDRPYLLKYLKNYYISYIEGRLVVRKGYDAWNAIALPASATQLYHFIDYDGNKKIFAISDGRWRVVSDIGSPAVLADEEATAFRPILTWEKRCLFSTDENTYWTDAYYADVPSSPSFLLGIEKPTSLPTITMVDELGNVSSLDSAPGFPLFDSAIPANGLLAYNFRPNQKTSIRTINIPAKMEIEEDKTLNTIGNIKVSIYTDDNGDPKELLNSKAVSRWFPINGLEQHYEYKEFVFDEVINLEANTDYHVVIEGDELYYLNHLRITSSHVSFAYQTKSVAKYAFSKTSVRMANPVWHVENGMEGIFTVGGIDLNELGTYDYIITYYNSQYNIESRPSENFRIELSATTPVVQFSGYAFPLPNDDQVDKIRIYRRRLDDGLEFDAKEDKITNKYYWVNDVEIGYDYQDNTPTHLLGVELQTQDHYTIRDTDDTGQNLRGEIKPYAWTIWKGRIWFSEKDRNVLYMSKKLTKDGASGQVGQPIPDYFPLYNKLEVPYPYPIVALMPLQSNQMAIYFKNGSIWLLWGCDNPLNPPDDYSLQEMAVVTGAVSTQAVCNMQGTHVYMSRNGIYAFDGTPRPQLLSEAIGSVLKGISDANLEKSILISFGNELWALIDADDDGTLDTVYIYDMQQSIPTWRFYQYADNLTDFVVRSAGQATKTILASSDTNYIFELEKSQDDNGQAITAMAEIHGLQLPQPIMIAEVSVDGYYPSSSPAYTITLIDHTGIETTYTLRPSSSYDVRGNRSGVRGVNPVNLGVRIESDNNSNNELIAINVGYLPKSTTNE